MRRFCFFLAIALLSKVIGAQDYQISFGILDDDETIIDSVVVHNLSQDQVITIKGDDILHLVASITGKSDLKIPRDKLEIYPNPFSNRATIVFQNDKQGMVELTLFEMAGKIVAQKRLFQSVGRTKVEVSGLPVGAYVIQIATETASFSEVILSNDVSGRNPEVNFLGSGENSHAPAISLKSSSFTAELVEMQYNEGDTLSLTAYHGGLDSKIKVIPVASTTISFEFHPNQEDIVATADITAEGGVLQVSDESGNIVTLTFPPGAVMDTVAVSLTLLGEPKYLPIEERQLRTFEIRPRDVSLYEPVTLKIEYNSPISEIEKAALFRIRSEEWLTPLSDHTYSDDNTSMTASTFILGDFAEGKMTLEEINAQFDLLVSALGISWESSLKAVGGENQLDCDTQLHKALWDDWKETIGGFLTIFRQRMLLGYYNDLEEGQHTFEEEQEILCANVVSVAINDVLDLCIPEDLCDRDYTYTIASMVNAMMLLGCENSTFNLLQARFDQILIGCSSYLTMSSTLNIESGGLLIETSGVVPITTKLGSNHTATVEGTGTLEVSGDGSAGGACSSTVSGETVVWVQGNRDAAYTYDIQLITEQNAVLTTTCPDGTTVHTPLVRNDVLSGVILSRANGYSFTYEAPVEGGTYVLEVILNNPYISLPSEE